MLIPVPEQLKEKNRLYKMILFRMPIDILTYVSPLVTSRRLRCILELTKGDQILHFLYDKSMPPIFLALLYDVLNVQLLVVYSNLSITICQVN
jgi:hypothetical protein